MINKLKNIGLIVLAVMLVYFYVKDLIREKQHAVDIAKIEFQEKQALRIVQIVGNLQRDVRRRKNGSIRVVTRFIPPEGQSEVVHNKDKTVTYNYHRFGLTFRPGIGMTYDEGRLLGLFSGKIAYAGRYGLVLNGGSEGIGFGVSRYISDVIPFKIIQNTELFLSYQIIQFKQTQSVIIGFRISL